MARENCPNLNIAVGEQFPKAICGDTTEILIKLGDKVRRGRKCEFTKVTGADCSIDSSIPIPTVEKRISDKGTIEVIVKKIPEIYRDKKS